MIVGPGRVGVALGYALWKAGALEALTYCGRRPEPPVHPLFLEGGARYLYGVVRPEGGTTALLLAVPDAVVPGMARVLAEQGPAPAGCAAFHVSGALTVEVLDPLHGAGYAVGSIHPLQAVADPVRGAELLRGSYFAVAGEPEARATARRLVLGLGGRVIAVAERKRPVYHAAAVMASGYLAVMVAAATRLLEDAGVAPEEALAALLPLARGTLDNLEHLEAGAWLTGPMVRGDVETVRMHLQALPEPERSLYRALGRAALELGERAGLRGEAVSALRNVFEPEHEVLRQH